MEERRGHGRRRAGTGCRTPFFVVATQNPLEQYGTYPLPEGQLDRFAVRAAPRRARRRGRAAGRARAARRADRRDLGAVAARRAPARRPGRGAARRTSRTPCSATRVALIAAPPATTPGPPRRQPAGGDHARALRAGARRAPRPRLRDAGRRRRRSPSPVLAHRLALVAAAAGPAGGLLGPGARRAQRVIRQVTARLRSWCIREGAGDGSAAGAGARAGSPWRAAALAGACRRPRSVAGARRRRRLSPAAANTADPWLALLAGAVPARCWSACRPRPAARPQVTECTRRCEPWSTSRAGTGSRCRTAAGAAAHRCS